MIEYKIQNIKYKKDLKTQAFLSFIFNLERSEHGN